MWTSTIYPLPLSTSPHFIHERIISNKSVWGCGVNILCFNKPPPVLNNQICVCVCVCVCVSHSVVCSSLQPHGLHPARLLCPWNSLGKNTGVGWQALLQGIFSIQGSNPGLLHCRQILYHLSHQGSPRFETH